MNLEIYTSNRCNFGCHYCCVTINEGPAVRADPAKVRKGIDQFLALPAPASFPERQVYFLGGEPLLDYALVHDAVEHIRSRDRSVGIRVYTNGSLLTPAIAAFLRSRGVQIWISLDGGKETNDAHRTFYGSGRSTYDHVARRVQEIGPEDLALNLVVHPDTAPRLVSDLRVFVAMGIRRVNIQPELYERYSPRQLAGLRRSLAGLGRYYAEETRGAGRLPFVMPILYAIMSSFSRLGEDIAPWWEECENVVLGADGRYYACERLLANQYSQLADFSVGDVDSGIDLEKKERWISQARDYLYRRGEKSREHYHCPKGDYLSSVAKGESPDPLLDSAHDVSQAFCRAFLKLAEDLKDEPAFRAVYIEKKRDGLADAGRPERLIYGGTR